MAFTPVEIRHVRLGRGALGYKRHPVDRVLAEVADSFETVWRERADLTEKVERLEEDLVRYRELDQLLRTTLVSAERAAGELKEQARREADLILGEAHAEARKVQRDAVAENERLVAESRKLRSALRMALETLDDVAADDVPPADGDDGDPQHTWPGEREAA
jgi:cell division initiation protein